MKLGRAAGGLWPDRGRLAASAPRAGILGIAGVWRDAQPSSTHQIGSSAHFLAELLGSAEDITRVESRVRAAEALGRAGKRDLAG
eukprot:4154406-Prymnesium_polylepis.1